MADKEAEKSKRRLLLLLCAGTPLIWVVTPESDAVEVDVRELCESHGWDFYQWNCVQGLQAISVVEHTAIMPAATPQDVENQTQYRGYQAPPRAAATAESRMDKISQHLAKTELPSGLVRALSHEDLRPDARAICVCRNMDRILVGAGAQSNDAGDLLQLQSLENFIPYAKGSAMNLVVVTPMSQMPERLRRRFALLDYDFPDSKEREGIVRRSSSTDEIPQLGMVVNASSGLTREELEQACAQSMITDSEVTVNAVWDLKRATIKGSGALSVFKPEFGFSALGGLEPVKQFMKRGILRYRAGKLPPSVRPRGSLLLGVAGSGKSALAKALGFEVDCTTLAMDMGKMFQGIVGSSEHAMRSSLKQADAMEPCILFVDRFCPVAA